MVFFVGVILSLAGMEMSAFHAREAKDPQRDYPRSILISALIILVLSILGSLAIALVVPPKDVSLFAGLMQAFKEFFKAFGISWALPWLALFAIIGSLAGVNTWIIGPAKGILASAQDGYLPPWMQTKNKQGMPIGTLLTQAVLGSVLSLVFFLMPTINSAFWIITALTVQFAMLMYGLIFLSAIKLRFTQPQKVRPYKIPGGQWGMLVVAGTGILAASYAFIIGFIPPMQLETGSILVYEGYLIGGLVGLSLPPVYFILCKKPHWQTNHWYASVEDS
jgi:amino acid transporter